MIKGSAERFYNLEMENSPFIIVLVNRKKTPTKTVQ